MTDALLLRFAQEELVYLLRALSIASFPGLEVQPLGKLNADQQALALAIADRTLRAKGTVGYDGQENRHVDPIIAGMVRDLAQPTYSVLVNLLRPGGLNLRYLYAFTRHAAIEHSMPEPGIHQFLLIPKPVDILAHIHTLLALEEVAQPADVVREIEHLSIERLEAARANASTNLNKATMLLSADLARETARELAAALATSIRVSHLALWHDAPDATRSSTPDTTLTIIQGDTTLFLLWKDSAQASQVDVIAATMLQVEPYVEKLLSPALAVMEKQAIA